MMGKKYLGIVLILILLFSIAGCGNPSAQSSSRATAESSPMESSRAQPGEEPPQSSAIPSSGGAASSGPAVQNGKFGSSSPALQTSSKTQQEVLNEIKTALHTKVPVLLPTGVPMQKGRCLTATTVSQPAAYKVNLYETVRPTEINSQTASKGTLLAAAEGTACQDAKSAAGNFPEYMQVSLSQNEDPVDLGHRIKAVRNAGLGHQQLIWNEGRWCVILDYPSDSTLQNKKYPDNRQLAKDVVAYLDAAMLPVPQKIGVINIGNWNQSNGTTVKWQKDRIVYQISSPDPMTALKVAVAMK